jgi:predicted nucleotidyltransferase
MTSTCINISEKIEDNRIVDLLVTIKTVADDLDISFFVVGAMARDLIVWYGYGFAPGRATGDVDLGVRASSWDEFNHLKDSLVRTGQFSMHGKKCRLLFRNDLPIDLLPFGLNGDEQIKTEWPPGDGEVLNMGGFNEAYACAILAQIKSDPKIVIKVASPEGLVLLKLIAWNDRKPENKDAIDLGVLVRSYLSFGNMKRLAEEHEDLLNIDDFDFEIAGAHLLGRDLVRICLPQTRHYLLQILNKELDTSGDLPLVASSAETSPQIDRTFEFWSAIRKELEI